MPVPLLKSADLRNMYHCQNPKHRLTNFVTSWRQRLVHHITSLWLMELRPLRSSREHRPGDTDHRLFLVMTWLKACSPYRGWAECTLPCQGHYNALPMLFFGVPTSYKLMVPQLFGWFFFLWSPCVSVLCIYVYVCVYMHKFKAGTVGWKHKCKIRSVNENWSLAENTMLDVDGDGK